MGIFVDYLTNNFSELSNVPQTIVSADTNVLWVTSLLICNRTAAPIRFFLQTARVQGRTLEKICYGATTGNLIAVYNNGSSGFGATLTNSGSLLPFSVDGLTVALNARILVKDQTTTIQNGIYTLSTIGSNSIPWILTRATDFDSVLDIISGDAVSVSFGTVNANTKWIQNSNVTAIGTSPITFIVNLPLKIFCTTEFEILPYKSVDICDFTGITTLQYNVTPYISDSLICFSNGYTQVFDCKVSYSRLNELPLT
jgi:hypothetical protein